jgi:hypothetical protein
MVQGLPKSWLVIRVFTGRVPSFITRLLAKAFRFLVQKVGDIGLWYHQNNDSEANACKNGENPEDPLKGKIS